MRTTTINITAYSRDTNSEKKQICNGYTPLKKRTYSKASNLLPFSHFTDSFSNVVFYHNEVRVTVYSRLYKKAANITITKIEDKLYKMLRSSMVDLSVKVNQSISCTKFSEILNTIKFNTLRRTEIFEKGSVCTLSCPQCLSLL